MCLFVVFPPEGETSTRGFPLAWHWPPDEGGSNTQRWDPIGLGVTLRLYPQGVQCPNQALCECGRGTGRRHKGGRATRFYTSDPGAALDQGRRPSSAATRSGMNSREHLNSKKN